jgi:hypothetical protein
MSSTAVCYRCKDNDSFVMQNIDDDAISRPHVLCISLLAVPGAAARTNATHGAE